MGKSYKNKKENNLAIWPQPDHTVSAESNKLNKSKPSPKPDPDLKQFLHLRPSQFLFSDHVSCSDGLQPFTELCELWSLGMKTRPSNCSHKFKHAEVAINSVFPPVSDDIDCVYSSCCSNLYDSLAYSTVGCILDHRVSWTGSRLNRVSHDVSKTDSDFLFLSKRDAIPLVICACSEQHAISFLFVPNNL